jgi:protein SCO1/2
MSKAFLPAAVILAALYSLYYVRTQRIAEELPRLAQVPNFTFTESSCGAFNSETLHGKIWLANLFFTSCGGPCPVVMSNLAKLKRSGELPDEVSLISITSDPETDTCQTLRQYSSKLADDSSNWSFLTGDLQQIIDFSVSGLKLGASTNAALHSTKIALIDGNGEIRGYYSGLDYNEIERLINDVKTLSSY